MSTQIKPEAENNFIVLRSVSSEYDVNNITHLTAAEAIQLAQMLLTQGLEVQQWMEENDGP